MPAKDLFHDTVRNALVKEGWVVTDDPYFIKYGIDDLFVDLGAERALAAQRGDEKIAVEIKSFAGLSFITDFHLALGQFLNYRLALEAQEPERILYLALPHDAYEMFVKHDLSRAAAQRFGLKLLVYNTDEEVIEKWLD